MKSPPHTGSVATMILGIATLVAIVCVVTMALVVSPADQTLGDTVRLLYLHVPIVTIAYTSCSVCSVASAVWLWRRTEWWDVVASASAEIALVFTGLTLATGAIWGRPTWGVYWVWDARLTTTLVLFLLLLGYQALRGIPAAPDVRARRSAMVGLLLLPNVFIVNRSVEWFRSLHQDATLFRTDLKFQIRDTQLFTLWVAFVAAFLLFAWLIVHRFRIGILANRVDELELRSAIEDRRAEGDNGPEGEDAA